MNILFFIVYIYKRLDNSFQTIQNFVNGRLYCSRKQKKALNILKYMSIEPAKSLRRTVCRKKRHKYEYVETTRNFSIVIILS